MGTNKKKAEAEHEANRTDIRGGRYKEPRRDSFDTLVEQYEAHQKTKRGYVSAKTYIKRAGEYFAGRIVRDIGIQDVERYKAYLEALPTRSKKNPATGPKVGSSPAIPGETHTSLRSRLPRCSVRLGDRHAEG